MNSVEETTSAQPANSVEETTSAQPAIHTLSDMLAYNDVVVTCNGEPLWYRGKVGEELKFTKPVRGNFISGRSITDVYYMPENVRVTGINTVELTGKGREDTCTDNTFDNPKFMSYKYTEYGLICRGVC
jgi:hypothetical protein